MSERVNELRAIKKDLAFFDRLQDSQEERALEIQTHTIYPIAALSAMRGQRLIMFTAGVCYPGQGGIDALRCAVSSDYDRRSEERKAA